MYWITGSLLLLSATSAQAFKIIPEGSFVERKLATRSQLYWSDLMKDFLLRGLSNVGESVHEEITNRMLGCEGDDDVCTAADYNEKNAYILAGVRWNDDPPFRFREGQGTTLTGCEPESTIRLVTYPLCWASVYLDGRKRVKQGEDLDGSSAVMLIRSHFGDLQFLHAMAERDGEVPTETRRRILMWAEFTWRTARREFSRSTRVRQVPVKGMKEFFGSSGWSIQDIFAMGNPYVRQPAQLSELAFGSLLHIVQDSFAAGHVERVLSDRPEKCAGKAGNHLSPGKIREFHSYGQQDAAKHDEKDSRNAFLDHFTGPKPTVVDVGRVLNEYFTRRVPWKTVKPYMECIFSLHPDARPSTNGEVTEDPSDLAEPISGKAGKPAPRDQTIPDASGAHIPSTTETPASPHRTDNPCSNNIYSGSGERSAYGTVLPQPSCHHSIQKRMMK